MVFKINISDKGKTLKIEIESEALIRSKIGDTIKGESFYPDLEGYELEITGTSDASGFPGVKGEIGAHLRKKLLRKGDKGLRKLKEKGLRIKKSIRGEEIGEKTTQVNMKVLKEGKKKFIDLTPKKEGESPAEDGENKKDSTEKPTEQSTEQQEQANPKEEPKETKEEAQEEAKPTEEPKAKEKEREEAANPDKEPKN